MKRKYEVGIFCNKCGKSQPPDEDQPTKNWIKYTMGKKCACGGEFVPSMYRNDKEKK